MSNRRSVTAATALLAASTGPHSAMATTGLAGLEGLQYVFFGAIAIAAVYLCLIIPGLLRAIHRKNQNLPATTGRKILLGIALTFVTLSLPLALGYMYRPFPNPWAIGIFLMWLVPVSLLARYFGARSKQIRVAVSILLVLMLLRAPQFISYTRYELIDNQPLPNPQSIDEQNDSEIFRTQDGQLYRFVDRYSYSSQGEKFVAGTLVEIEALGDSEETGVYTVKAAKTGQLYYQHKVTHVEPLITVPLRSERFDAYDVGTVGTVELLGDDWQATDQALFRAVNSFCCDPDWVEELLTRGADATYTTNATDWTLFHALASESPYGDAVDDVARLLASSGANVNQLDNRRQTGFHMALNQTMRDAFRDEQLTDSQRSYLKTLLDVGANPNILDGAGESPLHETIYRRFYSLTDLLLSHGANPGLRNGKGESALETAIRYRDKKNAVMSSDEHKVLVELVNRMQQTD